MCVWLIYWSSSGSFKISIKKKTYASGHWPSCGTVLVAAAAAAALATAEVSNRLLVGGWSAANSRAGSMYCCIGRYKASGGSWSAMAMRLAK